MFKRFIMVGLLSISMVMILGTPAKALRINGFGLRIGSLICEMKLEREESDPKNMLAQCILEPTEVEVVCEDKEYDDKWSRDDDDKWSRDDDDDRRTILIGQKQIDKNDFGRNGKKKVNIHISTDPLLDPDKCEKGESPTDVIVLDTKVRFAVFECIGGYHKPCSRLAKRPLDSVRADCELPFDDVPEHKTGYFHGVPEYKTEYSDDVPDVPESGTEYDCDELKSRKHRKGY